MRPFLVVILAMLSIRACGAEPKPALEWLIPKLHGKWVHADVPEPTQTYYFATRKWVIAQKVAEKDGSLGTQYTFYDYDEWAEWRGKRTLILQCKTDEGSFKAQIEFSEDFKSFQLRWHLPRGKPSDKIEFKRVGDETTP